MKRKRINASLVYSTNDPDLGRIHKKHCLDKYELQQIEVSQYTQYVKFCDKVIIIKHKKEVEYYRNLGLKIYIL